MTVQVPATIQVRPLGGTRDLRRFIRFPWSVYATDPNWVPPLLLERRQHLSPRNPVFAHTRWRAWLAWRGQEVVGRITAQISSLHLQRYADATGFFGMLEAVDDAEVFARLLATAESWLQEQGMQRVLGPFNLSINEECGLLVDGLDTPPSVMMGHARPYYPAQVEGHGYVPHQDLLAYRIRPDFDVPRVMRRLVDLAAPRVRLRTLRRSRLRQELEILRDIFNDAWSENWGFEPFTEAEFLEIGRVMMWLVPDDFVQIAEVDGEPAAMIIILPNVNEAIRDLNGRLAPLGWLKLLWRLKVRYPRTGRIPLMGVRKRYQHRRLGPALAFLVIDALREPVTRRGIGDVEMSWILESNAGMRNIIESIGGVAYKRYRIYGKTLAG